jgi:hypothetical protein
MLHRVAKIFQAISRLTISCRRLHATWTQHDLPDRACCKDGNIEGAKLR